MKKRILPLLTLLLLLLLTACGGEEPSVTADETPAQSTPEISAEETAYDGSVNRLTGMPIGEDWENARPIAVMLNNIKAAMPQLGVSQADIIYEALAEGGITRMLGVYQSVEGVGQIGSVRSARSYYLELALGHDAIFLHAGGSPGAYRDISAWGVTALDFVNGPYDGTILWRDAERRRSMGYEHSVITSGDAILQYLPTLSIRKEHKEDYEYEMTFSEDGAPTAGEDAAVISVPFSTYKTGVFTYDSSTGLYMVEQYGNDYVDGNTGEQVGVTNVIVISTACKVIAGDDAGRMDIDLTSGGEGWYACGGKIIPILWSKPTIYDQLTYTTTDGTPVTLGQGCSYVNIIPLSNSITFK